MASKSILERIVEERVGLATVGTVSAAVDRMADAFAREFMQDEEFKKTLHELVRRRSKELYDELTRVNGHSKRRRKRR